MLDEQTIDRLINKLSKLKELGCSVEELAGRETYLTTQDVAEKLGISEAEARKYMNRPDFPKLEVGKGGKVSSAAFFLYNLEARKT